VPIDRTLGPSHTVNSPEQVQLSSSIRSVTRLSFCPLVYIFICIVALHIFRDISWDPELKPGDSHGIKTPVITWPDRQTHSAAVIFRSTPATTTSSITMKNNHHIGLLQSIVMTCPNPIRNPVSQQGTSSRLKYTPHCSAAPALRALGLRNFALTQNIKQRKTPIFT
jgi:hypothetical protein